MAQLQSLVDKWADKWCRLLPCSQLIDIGTFPDPVNPVYMIITCSYTTNFNIILPSLPLPLHLPKLNVSVIRLCRLRFVTSFLFFSRSHCRELDGESSSFATTSLATENESTVVPCVAAGGRGAGRDLRWWGVAFGEGK